MSWKVILKEYTEAFPKGFPLKNVGFTRFFPSNHENANKEPTQLTVIYGELYVYHDPKGGDEADWQNDNSLNKKNGYMNENGLSFPADFNVCLTGVSTVDFKKISDLSYDSKKKIAFFRALCLLYGSEYDEPQSRKKIFVFDPELHVNNLFKSHEDITHRLSMHTTP